MVLNNIIEHRLDGRLKLSIPVKLRVQDMDKTKLEIDGVTKDIGRGGMFIEMEEYDLKSNCFEVYIAPEFIDKKNSIKIIVYLIHQCERGIGVMFSNTNQYLEQEL